MKVNRGVHVEELRKILYVDEEHQLRWRVKPCPKIAVNAVAGSDHYGYRRVTIRNKFFLSHRVIWAIHYGSWPSNNLDHINGIRNDNRIENLREATPQENKTNAKKSKNNKSGVTGVLWRKECSRWLATICVNYHCIHIGHFKDFFEAVCARKSAEVHYGFHANHGRTQ